MLFRALSAAVYGIDANLIDVEVDYSGVVTEKDILYTVRVDLGRQPLDLGIGFPHFGALQHLVYAALKKVGLVNCSANRPSSNSSSLSRAMYFDGHLWSVRRLLQA